MKKIAGLRAKTRAYLIDDDSEKKKAKETKNCVIKRRTKSENYKDCFFNNEIILKSRQGFKCDHHDLYTAEINKKALSSNNNKRL